MDEYGAGPFLVWIRDLFVDGLDALGLPSLPGALAVSYLAFGCVFALIDWPIRSRASRVSDALVSLRPALSRLWRRSGRRPRGFARDVGALLRDVGLRGRSLLWWPAHLLVLVLGVWAAVAPWGQTPFRKAVGQGRPRFAGRSFDQGFALGDDWLLTVAVIVMTWAFASVVSRALRAAWVRQRYLRSRPPMTGWGTGRLIALGLAVAAVLLLANWNDRMGLPWASAVLLFGFSPVLWLNSLHDRGKRPMTLLPPAWVWTDPSPARSATPERAPQPVAATRLQPIVRSEERPERLEKQASERGSGAGRRSPADAVPTQAFAASADHTPTQAFSGAADRTPTQALAGVADRTPTQVVPRADTPSPVRPAVRTWSDLATPITALSAHEPTRVGPWTIVGRIGTGGMAIVYLARDAAGRQVALKVANPMVSPEMQAPSRMLREIMALSRVGGRQVVPVVDVGVDHEHPWIAMEYLPGPTLNTAVRSLGPVPDRERLQQLAAALAGALASIHSAGVTHRDLKPHNIMLTDRGPVVVDLGIARLADAGSSLTQTGLALGSYGYVAPELLLSTAHSSGVDGRADVWAWGACMAFAASGRALFAGGHPAAALTAVVDEQRDRRVMDAVAALDPALARLVWDCTAADPHRRPADGAVLCRVLPDVRGWLGPW